MPTYLPEGALRAILDARPKDDTARQETIEVLLDLARENGWVEPSASCTVTHAEHRRARDRTIPVRWYDLVQEREFVEGRFTMRAEVGTLGAVQLLALTEGVELALQGGREHVARFDGAPRYRVADVKAPPMGLEDDPVYLTLCCASRGAPEAARALKEGDVVLLATKRLP